MQVRLNKALADLGVASRRKADELIAEGKVSVNGVVVSELGVKVDAEKDVIAVEGRAFAQLQRERVVIMLNKPAGVETSSVRRNSGPIVLDLVEDAGARVFPVGRLDKASRGLILLTNDGLLAYRLTHPKFEKEKEYLVRVAGVVTEQHLDRVRAGVQLLGTRTKPAAATKLGNSVFKIVLTEGKNRQIRRMMRKVDLPVTDLQRVRVGSLRLGALPEGKWRALTPDEIRALDPGRPS